MAETRSMKPRGTQAGRPRYRRILALTTHREAVRVNRLLRAEVVGGIIIIVAAALGILAANSPLSDAYFSLRETTIGPESLHLNLSIGAWASDGLLAIFFFMVGL